MTWNMQAQTWVERQVTFYCADQPFAEGAMRKAYYIKFERNDRARGGDRMCVLVERALLRILSLASFHLPHAPVCAGLWPSSPRTKSLCTTLIYTSET